MLTAHQTSPRTIPAGRVGLPEGRRVLHSLLVKEEHLIGRPRSEGHHRTRTAGRTRGETDVLGEHSCSHGSSLVQLTTWPKAIAERVFGQVDGAQAAKHPLLRGQHGTATEWTYSKLVTTCVGFPPAPRPSLWVTQTQVKATLDPSSPFGVA
jgi:hypothetical protein